MHTASADSQIHIQQHALCNHTANSHYQCGQPWYAGSPRISWSRFHLLLKILEYEGKVHSHVKLWHSHAKLRSPCWHPMCGKEAKIICGRATHKLRLENFKQPTNLAFQATDELIVGKHKKVRSGIRCTIMLTQPEFSRRHICTVRCRQNQWMKTIVHAFTLGWYNFFDGRLRFGFWTLRHR